MEEFLGASLNQIVTDIIIFIPNIIAAVIIFVVALYVGRLVFVSVRKTLIKRNVDPELSLLFARLSNWSIIIFGTVWALAQVNFDVTSFVAGLGIIGFTVGFALKDIAENFVAGILLLMQQPFNIGDAVVVADQGGVVEDIEIRSTTIRTWDGLLVIIPNASVYSNPITNYSRINKRRVSLTVGVSYDTDLDLADAIMLEVVDSLPGIKDDPEPFVVFNEFADSSINATVYFWIDTSEAGYFGTQDAVVKGIKVAFDREGISIPFPIQMVYPYPWRSN